MSIGNQIKKLRKEIGLTQKELGSKIGVHFAQLARYEAGRSIPSIDVLKKIANYCEVSIDYLAYGEDKDIQKKFQINDTELLDLLRRTDHLKKSRREHLKWVITALLKETAEELNKEA